MRKRIHCKGCFKKVEEKISKERKYFKKYFEFDLRFKNNYEETRFINNILSGQNNKGVTYPAVLLKKDTIVFRNW
jgi:hypothetical protein